MNVQTPNGFALDNSGRRMVVDPVTRIEGHMRCEVNLDSNNIIRNAVSTGTMWRGLEIILKGRDPRDAWAFCERICGVCTGTHALTSVRAVENALGIQIPENANTIRNMMQLTLWVHDHLVHFYHLHALDWVDVISALKADPKATSALAQSISPWAKSSPGYFSDVQARLQRFVDSGQLGPFMNGYWGNPAYLLPPEANLMATAHYLEALDFQREIVKIHTVFGGKNPHPNWLVGGMACAINMDATMGAGAPVNVTQLNLVADIISRTIQFIDQVYVPDMKAIASFYKNWDYGQGLAGKNVISYGEFPLHANDYTNLMIPRGAIINGNLNEILPVDLADLDQVQEFVDHSWYKYPDESKGLHPWEGITDPNFELGPNTIGTKTNIQQLDEGAKYSYIKAARWRGHAMEVGPLSRFTLGYAQGNAEFKDPVDKLLTDLGLPFNALFTTLGRTAARALEASWAAHKLQDCFDHLIATIAAGDSSTANTDNWEPTTWPSEVKGVGFAEAPRGALGHWLHIKDAKIESYQAVVPTTWNGSPRDPAGNVGAFEAALLGTPLANPNQPLEILRTLHSFDPCLACSTHVMAPDGGELVRVQVR
ncbi:nickel-dependent hydrogenase large subunit [Acidocella aromatica]|uniref:Uptake hydrogenase large subunit n=1 Tax=Acidocella aromatica TaxID=1303579 RepID=A0A840VPN4_9PROT|nr:nickel-dependent hydrogenase large subunit [Acidocella aromatica]MBB5373551.1 hydrogenase large subunit [Acidocella aromatica]